MEDGIAHFSRNMSETYRETVNSPREEFLDATSPVLVEFARQFGGAATHAAFAPGRVNLIGEHTDYNGGFVLPLAMDRGVFIAARRRDDGVVRLASELMPEVVEFSVRESVRSGEPAWSNYVRGVVAGLQQAGAVVPGFDAFINATLPAGGGLSSSAALELATAVVLEAMTGTVMDPVQRAFLAQKAEHEFAGTPCGIMDQFAVTFGQRGHLLLIDCESLERMLVPMSGDDTSILVINTMVKHALNDGGYRRRRHECEGAAAAMGVRTLRHATLTMLEATAMSEVMRRRARHVITENERTLKAVAALRAADWQGVGQCMAGSHESLRNDFEVSCAELDCVVELARGMEGVHGCRMTGGGFGGCCVALIESSHATAITESLRDGYQRATGIAPTIFITRPSDGARLLNVGASA